MKYINKISGGIVLLMLFIIFFLLIPIPTVYINNTEGCIPQSKTFSAGGGCFHAWSLTQEDIYLKKINLFFNEKDFSSIFIMAEKTKNYQLIDELLIIADNHHFPQYKILYYIMYFSQFNITNYWMNNFLDHINFLDIKNQKSFALNYCYYGEELNNGPNNEKFERIKNIFLKQGVVITCKEKMIPTINIPIIDL